MKDELNEKQTKLEELKFQYENIISQIKTIQNTLDCQFKLYRKMF